MILDKINALFIHIPRCAGTSMEWSLKKYTSYRIVKINPDTLRVHERHTRALDIRKKIGRKKFKRYFKFSFIRNPWERLVSLYNMRTKLRTDYLRVSMARKGKRRRTKRYNLLTFHEFLKFATIESMCWHIMNNNSEILVDFIGRFENVEVDFRKVCNHLGLKSDLCHMQRFNYPHYRVFYDQKSKNLAYKRFKKDIKTFSYEF